MTAAGDLQVDLDGLEVFAENLDRLAGQRDGSATSLDPYSGMGSDPGLTGPADDFTTAWSHAATSIDSFIGTLASMRRDAVASLRQTDADLADRTAVAHNHRIFVD